MKQLKINEKIIIDDGYYIVELPDESIETDYLYLRYEGETNEELVEMPPKFEKVTTLTEKPSLYPSWKICPKCNSTNIEVEKCVFFIEIFNKGNLRSRTIEPASKIGPTTTTCIECSYEDEEDVE